MKYDKAIDIFLNIIAPVLNGCLIYFVGNSILLPVLITNYLPDGLWAYAFISCILIIWQREINIPWITITFLIAVVYELLQHYHIVAGTGDLYDVITYFLFFIIALVFNQFYKTRF